MARMLPTIMLFLHLMLVVSPSNTSKCSEPLCDPTSCPKMGPKHNYNGTKGFPNGVTESTTAHRVNSTYTRLQWNGNSLHPKLDWDRYMVMWRFDYTKKFKCAILPKSETTLVVADEPNKPPRDEMEVLLDILPLPNNWENFWRKEIEIKQGPTSSSSSTTQSAKPITTKTTTPEMDSGAPSDITSSGPTSSSSSTTQSAKPITTKTTTPEMDSGAPSDITSSEGRNWTLATGLVALFAVVVMALCFCSFRYHKSTLKGPGGESTHCMKKNDPHRTPIVSGHSSEYRKRSYVVSYWPENDKYIEKIASIVAWFRESAGYAMIMDKMATTEICSKGHVRWAESEIHKAEKVLVFLSPGYINTYMKDDFDLKMSTDEEKRVWYEMQILKGIYSSTRSANKIVCVLTDDKTDTYVPPPWVVVTYRWPVDKDKILMRLNELPEITVEVTDKFSVLDCSRGHGVQQS